MLNNGLVKVTATTTATLERDLFLLIFEFSFCRKSFIYFFII